MQPRQTASTSDWARRSPQIIVLAAVCFAAVIAVQTIANGRLRNASNQSAEAIVLIEPEGRLLPGGAFKEKTAESEPPANCTREVLEGVELVINVPPSPQRFMLLFHGLPEEVRVVRTLLARSYVAVAVSSADQRVGCFDSEPGGHDMLGVARAVKALTAREGWTSLPRYAFGVSSGGAFALLLALRMPLAGVISQVMDVPASYLMAWSTSPAALAGQASYPPAVFVHMQRDIATAEGVAEDIAAIKKLGAAVREQVVVPRPLTPGFFAERIEGLSGAASVQMFKALQAGSLLNATGFLNENPRRNVLVWQSVIKEAAPSAANLSLAAEVSPVFEELNLAWAGHEIVSDEMDENLAWLEARSAPDKANPKLMTVVKPRR